MFSRGKKKNQKRIITYHTRTHVFALIKIKLCAHRPAGAAPGTFSLRGASQAEFPPRSKIRQVGNRQLRKLQEPCDLRKHTAWEVNKLLNLSASHSFTRRHLRGCGLAPASAAERRGAGAVQRPAQAPRAKPSLLASWMCVTPS